MMTKWTILVPLDGSPLSERALPYAERLAEVTSARIVLCRALAVFAPRPADDLDSADEARAYLQRLAEQLSNNGRTVETALLWGEAAPEILKQVRSAQAQLVVMGTHGRSGIGRWLYGSVADEVLRHATVPILLVPPGATMPWSANAAPRIVVPLDGSELSEAALGPAGEWAVRLGSEVALLQVIPFPPYPVYGDGSAYLAAFDSEAELAEAKRYLATVAERLPSSMGPLRVLAELGQPAVAIAQRAAMEKFDLIAMATHGRSGLARLVLGSVATGTLQRANVPVLLVRPAALHERAAQLTIGSEEG